MRRWTLLSAGILALGVVALSGQFLVSQTGGEKKSGGPPTAGSGPAVKSVNNTREASKTGIEPTTAKSRIVKVTVYPSNALGTREVQVPAGQGLAELGGPR